MVQVTVIPSTIKELDDIEDVESITKAQGQLIYADGTPKWNALAVGTSGQFLKTQGAGANPVWAAQVAPTPAYKVIDSDSYKASTGGDLYWNGTLAFNGWRLTADAQYNQYDIWLEAGTYTCYMTGMKDTDSGISDIYIDAAEVASFDWYNASATLATQSQASISVASDGVKTIKVIVDGKHASSSAYNVPFQMVVFVKTA